jgi:hypothetical protein
LQAGGTGGVGGGYPRVNWIWLNKIVFFTFHLLQERVYYRQTIQWAPIIKRINNLSLFAWRSYKIEQVIGSYPPSLTIHLFLFIIKVCLIRGYMIPSKYMSLIKFEIVCFCPWRKKSCKRLCTIIYYNNIFAYCCLEYLLGMN